MEKKYETLYYIYNDIKYNTLEEVEKIIQEEKWNEIYSLTYNFIVFQIKFWILLFLIFQIVNNLVNYWEKKSNQTPYDEETKKKIKEQLEIGMKKSYVKARCITQLLPEEEKEEALRELRALVGN